MRVHDLILILCAFISKRKPLSLHPSCSCCLCGCNECTQHRLILLDGSCFLCCGHLLGEGVKCCGDPGNLGRRSFLGVLHHHQVLYASQQILGPVGFRSSLLFISFHYSITLPDSTSLVCKATNTWSSWISFFIVVPFFPLFNYLTRLKKSCMQVSKYFVQLDFVLRCCSFISIILLLYPTQEVCDACVHFVSA
jgi:hypothetical protein